MTRHDRRGRRIGRNRWRELVVDAWRCADHAWWLRCEAATSLWASEVADFKREDPRPTLKSAMVTLAGTTCYS